MPDDKPEPRRLQVAQSNTEDVRTLPPLTESFPASKKTMVSELEVPVRRITLTDGEELDVYDTSGPQDHDPRQGVPKRRQPWIDARVASSDGNLSQMHYARQGVVTEEMRFVAIRE
ncbi:MAG: phosphomethylpyrimidine synthase, partial [Nannocystaceae bacterium]